MHKLKIIETSDYILAVSEKEIKDVNLYQGRYHLENKNTINVFPNYLTALSECKLIIAYQTKGNTPELDLPLLPKIVVKDDVEKLAIEKYPILEGGSMWMPTRFDLKELAMREGFIEQLIMERKYSEDDLRNMFILGGKYKTQQPDKFLEKMEEIIQSLKQPVFKWFVAETFEDKLFDMHTPQYDRIVIRLKTTTINGKTYLVGKYLNE